MNALDDYNNLFFEGVWDFMKAVPCLQNRRVRGPSGMIQYESVTIDESEVYFIFNNKIQKKKEKRNEFNFTF